MPESLQQLRDARVAHLRWLSHAKALIEGIPLSQDQVPIHHTDCQFGQWFYSSGSHFNHLDAYQQIEKHHSDVHDTYMKIVTLIFQEAKPSLLEKFLGKASKIGEKNRLEAEKLYQQMQRSAKAMQQHLQELENHIKLTITV